MHSLLTHYLTIWRPLGYLLAFLAMIFEGDGVLFIIGFLTHEGLFDPFNIYLTLLMGVLVGDSLWYWLGLKVNVSSLFFGRWAEKIAKPFDDHLIGRPFRTIFISKFIYGLHHAILIRAGELKLRWNTLIKDDFLPAVLWVLSIGGLGYLSSASFTLVKHYVRFSEIALLIGLVVFFTIWHFIASSSKKKL